MLSDPQEAHFRHPCPDCHADCYCWRGSVNSKDCIHVDASAAYTILIAINRGSLMPTEPQDLVTEARALLAQTEAYWKGGRPLQAVRLLRQLCDEVERLRKQIKTIKQDARDAALDAATEARWQEKQGEDYGSY